VPEIDDTEQELDVMQGVENSWQGRMLKRLTRLARTATVRVRDHEQRIRALEQKAGIVSPPEPPDTN
jgi:hypothetical protein